MPPTTPVKSKAGQAAASRIAEARQNVNNGATPQEARATVKQLGSGSPNIPKVDSAVKASDLATPPRLPVVPEPAAPSIPPRTGRLVSNVARDVGGFIKAQSEEADRLRDAQMLYGEQANAPSLSTVFEETKAKYGVTPDTLQELKDIELQLADMDTESALTKTRIEGGAGQTQGQAQREVTQEDREAAVRSAGKAARAAVLRGNLETANTLARDTVNIAFQDRQLQATNLLNQINMLQGQVDEQTAQLLEQDKRQYEGELAAIEELKTNIASAMVSGASQGEIAQLNAAPPPNATPDQIAAMDAQKLQLAQQITARGATQMRNLDIQSKQASIANSYDQIAARKAAVAKEVAEAATVTEKAEKEKQAASEQALEVKALAGELLGAEGISAAVGFGLRKSLVGGLPWAEGKAIAGTDRADFEAKADRLANLLTLDNLDLMSGVLSETDIKILETAGSNLRNFDMSEEAYLKEVNRIVSTMDRTINTNGITPEQAAFWGVVEESDLETLNSLWEAL